MRLRCDFAFSARSLGSLSDASRQVDAFPREDLPADIAEGGQHTSTPAHAPIGRPRRPHASFSASMMTLDSAWWNVDMDGKSHCSATASSLIGASRLIPRVRITARSMKFASSRILPGHEWRRNAPTPSHAYPGSSSATRQRRRHFVQLGCPVDMPSC